MASPNVAYLHVVEPLTPSTTIPLDNLMGQYIRVQMADQTILGLTEVIVYGYEEICGNGSDDDCDGLVDCEDGDCGAHALSVNTIQPTCPACPNGKINVLAISNGATLYSIDGGTSFHTNSPQEANSKVFEGLLPGHYNVFIESESGCLIEYPNNPVHLHAPIGGLHGSCFNGGFEEGTHEGWTGGLGEWNGLPTPWGSNEIEFDNEDLDNPGALNSRHAIIPTGGVDPYVSELELSPPSGQNYMIRLGNDQNGREAERLTYCFIVDQDNADFYFNFAVVLENPTGHQPNQMPFFSLRVWNNSQDIPIAEELHVSSANDPFFTPSEFRPHILYKDWACDYLDLHTHMGQEVCIEFTTADCDLSEHFGYAYIDGLCSTAEDNEPIPDLQVSQDYYCDFAVVTADGSGSNLESAHTWTVCKLENGQTIECFSQTEIGLARILDVEEFYLGNPFGYEFECNQEYIVTLEVDSECAVQPASVTDDLFVECTVSEVEYNDLVICSSSAPSGIVGPFQFEGVDLGCGSCTYQWSPPQGLSDPTAAFPEVTLPSSEPNREYTVTVNIPGTTCTYTETVSVINIINPQFLSLEIINETYCEYTIEARLRLNTGVPSGFDLFDLVWLDGNTGMPIDETPSTPFQVEPGIFSSQITISKEFDERVITVEANWNTNDLIWYGENDCSTSISQLFQGDDTYFGHFAGIYIPNAFVPNGNGIDDRWEVYFEDEDINDNDGGNYKAYWYSLTIYQDAGNIYYDIEEYAPLDQPFPDGHIGWDGFQRGCGPDPFDICYDNGEPITLPVDVYVYKLNFENCTYQRFNGVYAGTCVQPLAPGQPPCVDCAPCQGANPCNYPDECYFYPPGQCPVDDGCYDNDPWSNDITLIN